MVIFKTRCIYNNHQGLLLWESMERYVAYVSKVHELGLGNVLKWCKTLEWRRASKTTLPLLKDMKLCVTLLALYVDKNSIIL